MIIYLFIKYLQVDRINLDYFTILVSAFVFSFFVKHVSKNAFKEQHSEVASIPFNTASFQTTRV